MYSNADILAAMERGDIIIDPFNPGQLGTNSYDVCLGNTFYEVHWNSAGPFFIGPIVYLDGEKVTIPVSGTLLGVTKEIVVTKNKVVAELRSRSTTRRIGITTNCDAGLGDVGYGIVMDEEGKEHKTPWTMEFTAFIDSGLTFRIVEFLYNFANHGGWITKLYRKMESRQAEPYLLVGQRVAQMVFYECKSEPVETYHGQYAVNPPLNMIPAAYRHRIIKPSS